jgi:hypothetical protein
MSKKMSSVSTGKIDVDNHVDSQNPETLNYDRSEELRQANSMALAENTRAEGVKMLHDIITKHPDCSDPYCLLEQVLINMSQVEKAEKLLLEAFPKVLKKSKIASALGSHYFFQRKNLPKSIEWYVKSVATAGSGPIIWSPYLYLSGIYNSFGFGEIASDLQGVANQVRGNPVDLDTNWQHDLETRKSQVSEKMIHSLLEKAFEQTIAPILNGLKKKSKTPAAGSVYRPDLKCSICGNANVVFSYYDHTHEQCVECEVIFCKNCRTKHGWRCPNCGAMESMNYIEEPPDSKKPRKKWWMFWRR